jgi:phosphomannomutase
MNAFHAYDIRGIFEKDFTLDDVYRIGFYLPQLLNTTRILVGRDCRQSSDAIFEYLAKGITDAGADVYDVGLATTPMVYFLTAQKQFDASVQITASHNPKEYNGLKVSRTSALPVGYESGLNKLESLIKQEPTPVSQKGNIVPFDESTTYSQFLQNYVSPKIETLNIVVDISNGMAGLFIKELLGKKPYYINESLDGNFPGHAPNPLEPKNIIQLQEAVKTHSADIGVIFDGDADRVMFVDEQGQFISPDLLIALLGHYFLKNSAQKAIVLQDIRTSKAVPEYIAKHWANATVEMWKVGRANAALKLRELDGYFGGELAGHYYFRDFFYSDSGIMAALILLEVFADFKVNGLTVSQVIADIQAYENSGEINFKLSQKDEAMEAVKQYFISQETPSAIYDFDGYRIEYPDWWFNIRKSNTEPYLRLLVEAKTISLLQTKLSEIENIIKKFD